MNRLHSSLWDWYEKVLSTAATITNCWSCNGLICWIQLPCSNLVVIAAGIRIHFPHSSWVNSQHTSLMHPLADSMLVEGTVVNWKQAATVGVVVVQLLLPSCCCSCRPWRVGRVGCVDSRRRGSHHGQAASLSLIDGEQRVKVAGPVASLSSPNVGVIFVQHDQASGCLTLREPETTFSC